MKVSPTEIVFVALLLFWVAPPVRRRFLPRYRALAMGSVGFVFIVGHWLLSSPVLHLFCAALGFLLSLSAFLHVRTIERKEGVEPRSLRWYLGWSLRYLPAILVALVLLTLLCNLAGFEYERVFQFIREWGRLLSEVVLLMTAYYGVFFALFLWRHDRRTTKQ